jgi:predicted DNA-binding transcriptional regulator AlpA
MRGYAMRDDTDEMLTATEACALLAGHGRPMHAATFYRGIAAGRWPRPVHIAPNISRWLRSELLAARQRAIEARNGDPGAVEEPEAAARGRRRARQQAQHHLEA